MRILPFKLERFFSKYEFKAPYLLCTSDCESLSIEELLSFEAGSIGDFKKLWLGYTEAEGNPSLKSEISKLYTRSLQEDILVHSGAEEGIFTFMNTALQAGDHIIVHYPCYQSLFEIANSIGCEVTRWQTSEKDNWELNCEFLEESIKDNTKAIIINCPHNPTGYLMSKDKLFQIVEIAREHNIILLSDEVYRFLEYRKEDTLPAVCDLYDRGVSLGVMSKTLGLAGLRIGWIATKDRQIFEGMASFKDYTSICNSAPSEFLAALALRHKDRIIKRNIDIVLKNLDILDSFFNLHSDVFNWQRPRAGSIAFPSFSSDMEIEDFCIDLVEKSGVLLLPGSCYDKAYKNFRIGFGRKNMYLSVEKLDQYMKKEFKSRF